MNVQAPALVCADFAVRQLRRQSLAVPAVLEVQVVEGVFVSRVIGARLVVLLRDCKLMFWSLGDFLDSWNSVAEVKEDKAYLAFFCLRYPPLRGRSFPRR